MDEKRWVPEIITIDLMRHGVSTAGSCFLGATDAPLTQEGWEQMQASVVKQRYDRVISSPLMRCAAFAKHYAEKKNLPLSIEHDLKEIDFGAWEGKTSAEIWETQQQLLSAFWEDPLNNTPPEGEPYRVFQQRVDRAFKALSDQPNSLIITHGGVIRQIISSILCLPFEKLYCMHIDYAGITRIESCKGDLSLRFINQRV
ncbi:Alpha-ribazole-5'-phosphate phosphatase [hydrothermal vent metagenome]|uniref:Alpha-ribazole-5'-phosphate phosphatase n=1 Tax=hydrothermal vent metagenome TaxID=652676 RepID=A0A3B0XPL5_9ZZZZ